MPVCDAECAAKGIPARLHTLSRAKVAEFAPAEFLFMRHPALGADAIYIGQIPEHVEDQSVNRERFCESPLDVLYDTKNGQHFVTYEIAKVSVGEIEAFRFEAMGPQKKNERGELKTEVRRFTLKAVHDPTQCMFPHSIIQLHENGAAFDRKNAPKSAKTNIRREFARIANRYRSEMLGLKPDVEFGRVAGPFRAEQTGEM